MKTLLNKILYKLLSYNNKNNYNYLPSNFVIYRNDFISKEIISNGLFEEFELLALKKNIFNKIDKKVVLDIGANIGNHTHFFSSYFKKVYSFEPHPTNFELLHINTKNLGNVKIFNLGLSDKKSSTYLKLDEKDNFGSFTATNKKTQYKISLDKLDNVLKDNLKNIDLIKIDVEGHELNVLQGATEILKKNSAIIIFELIDHTKSSKLLDLLKNNDYMFFYEFNFSRILYQKSPTFYKYLKFKYIYITILKVIKPNIFFDYNQISNFQDRNYPLIIASKTNLKDI